MANIRDVTTIANKWASVTPQRVGDYQDGIANPKTDWKAATLAASETFKSAMQAVLQNDSFKKGVTRSSTAEWQSGAVEKGGARWGPGVQLAQAKYEANFAPYRAAIAAVKLPPRYAKRDPRNHERVLAINKALADTKARIQSGA